MPHRTTPHRVALAAAAFCSTLALSGPSLASSHREAPSIAMQPAVDATDLYLFRSYETGRQDYVTVLANYIPFQDPQGGPNFYQFNPNALYEIKFDNNGDGKEDLSFQFKFTSTSKGAAFMVGGKSVKVPLIDAGPIAGVNPATLNVRETFTIDAVRGQTNITRAATRLAASDGTTVFDKPVDYIGTKTLGNAAAYDAYAAQHVYTVAIPGCGSARVFVGQRKEPFYIAVGKIFDLINLNPLGAEVGGNKNDLEAKNVSTIAMEIPIACLATAGDPVIGAFTTASVRQTQLPNPAPASGLGHATDVSGSWVQVSRLGMPLVNEVVIGLDDKDRFNASKPMNDGTFADYVTNPTLPALIETLYPSAKAPTNFPRTDLVTAWPSRT